MSNHLDSHWVELMEQGALHVMQVLLGKGHRAFMVGGCVRDRLMNVQVKDIDIATSAAPETVLELFDKVIPTGLQHGTVTVLYKQFSYEVTTFRKENEYVNHRHPKTVQFVDELHEDLLRRDFTINAMALDVDAQLIDPYDGLEDIKRGIIRCVGNAHERFEEDALRMMRAIRFAARFRFRIEDDTWKAALMLAPLMEHIAMERVRTEWELMLQSKEAGLAIQLLADSGMLKRTRNELAYRFVWNERIRIITSWIDQMPIGLGRWGIWAWASELSPGVLRTQLQRMTCSKHQANDIVKSLQAFLEWYEFICNHLHEEDAVKLQWKRGIVKYERVCMCAVLEMIQIFHRMNSESFYGPFSIELLDCSRIEFVISSSKVWDEEVKVTNARELAISGHQVMQILKKTPGPWLSEVINHLIDVTAIGEIPNHLDVLESYIQLTWGESADDGHAH